MRNLVILFTLLFFTHSLFAKTTPQTQIDDMLSSWNNQQKPGLALMVSRGDTTLYKQYFGLADLAHNSQIKHDTVFQIASVSKQFTAFAISLLVQENKLSLSDDIRQYLPELKDNGMKITVLHLIHHTSGLRDLDDLNAIVGTGFSDYNDASDVYKLVVNQSATNFTPGERYDYSNTGYVLLAKIIENITGNKFREFMQDRVFGPLGMTNTLIFDNSFEVVQNRATAYFSGDGKTFSRDNGISSVYGSTGVYTSLEDLDRWARNFHEHKVGNQALFDMMLTEGVLNSGESTHYAFGQEIKTYKGHKAVFHGGGTGAYRSYLLRFPEQKLSISLLSNNSYSTNMILDYVYQIADLYIEEIEVLITGNKVAETLPMQAIEPNLLAAYQGDYQIQPGLIFSISLEKEYLQLSITGNPKKIQLKAITVNEFELMDSDNGNRILFSPKIDSVTQSIRYFQGDFEYKGQRIELVEFNEKDIPWQSYEGLYYSEDLNTVYKLSYDGAQLKAIHARNLPIKLSSFQPDIFTTKASFFQEVTFIRNSKGQVAKMLVSGSRSKHIEFVKIDTVDQSQ